MSEAAIPGWAWKVLAKKDVSLKQAAWAFGCAKKGSEEERLLLERFWAVVERERTPGAPIDMVLHCPNPKCGHQHVDAPEPGTDWTNPPHKSHKCHGCGTVWRPADVPTNGVAVIATRGKADTVPIDRRYAATEFAEKQDALRAAKDAAYEERNQVVALLARMALALGWRAGIGEHENIPGEAWEPDWRTLLCIDLPTGQASWHFHDSHRHLLDGLPPYAVGWDGHDTPEKYRRVRAALTSGDTSEETK